MYKTNYNYNQNTFYKRNGKHEQKSFVISNAKRSISSANREEGHNSTKDIN